MSNTSPKTSLVLPDGRRAELTGQPDRFPFPVQGGPASWRCLVAVLSEARRSLPEGDPVSIASMQELAERHGVPLELVEAGSLEDLALQIELERAVIVVVNAGSLWSAVDALGHGECNHAVLVTAVARDPATQQVLGFLVRDPVAGDPGFAASDRLLKSWLVPGGALIAIGS